MRDVFVLWVARWQLDEEATKLGHYLVEAGVGPHSVVPVVMEKGRLAPVAMLAVLKYVVQLQLHPSFIVHVLTLVDPALLSSQSMPWNSA